MMRDTNQKAIQDAFAFDPKLGAKVLAARMATTGENFWQPKWDGKDALKSQWTAFSVVAFLFVFIPYFYRGMWKKGVILLVCPSIPFFLTGSFFIELILVFSFYAGFNYYSDCHRKFVKKEDFWF